MSIFYLSNRKLSLSSLTLLLGITCVFSVVLMFETQNSVTTVAKESDRESSMSRISQTPSSIEKLIVINKNSYFVSDSKTGLWKTTDKGKSWKNILAVKNLKSLFFLNDALGFVLSDKVLMTSDDGGETWKDCFKFSQPPTVVYFIDKHHGWVFTDSYSEKSGFYSEIWKTSDSGKTWNLQPIEGNEYLSGTLKKQSLNDIFFLDSAHGWAVGENVVLETKNGGENWVIKKQLTGEFRSVMFSSSKYGLIIDKHLPASIFTTNYGETWNDVEVPQIRNNSKIIITKNNLIVAETSGYIMAKKNKGKLEDLEIENERFNDLLEKEQPQNVTVGIGFDESIVCLWDFSGTLVPTVSLNEGNSWN